MNKDDLQNLHNYMRSHKNEIFKDLIKKRTQVEYLKSLRDMSISELESQLNYKSPIPTKEERLPICDYLVYKLGDEIEEDVELQNVVSCEKYIWEVDPHKVASIFNRIGLSFELAVEKIKNQYIYSTSSSSVLARSGISTSPKEIKDSVSVFQISIQESKREQFLKELSRELHNN